MEAGVMDLFYYLLLACWIALFVWGMLKASSEKKPVTPPVHEDEVFIPEVDPDIYNRVLVYLLIEAELRALELVQQHGDDEAGKGAKV
jgi:hypothetical protein